MNLPTLALLTRALREDSRLARSYYGRFGLALLLLLALLLMHMEMRFMGSPGLRFFTCIVFINFFVVTLAGISFFSTVITEEKEEATLGLLRMTSLSPVSILLGKSAVSVWYGVTLLLVQIPFILLAVTLGGVMLIQIIAAYCTLVAYLLFVSALALFCSTVCQRGKSASGLTGFMLFAFFLAPPFGTSLMTAMIDKGWLLKGGLVEFAVSYLVEGMETVSAFNQLVAIISTGFAGPVVGWQVVGDVALAVILFLGAWAVFDFFTREQKDAMPGRGMLPRSARKGWRLFGAGRPWRCWQLAWKDFHFMAGGRFFLVVKFIGIGVFFFCLHFGKEVENRDLNEIGVYIQIIMIVACAVELSFQAGRIFGEEIQWRTLPDLMLLPIHVRRLAYQKAAGCLPGLVPYLFYYMIGVYLAPDKFSGMITDILSGGTLTILGIVFGALFFLHLIAFLSLVVKRGALGLAFVISVFGFYLFVPLASVFLYSMNSGSRTFVEEILTWCGVLLLMLLTVLLHYLIGNRLVKVAAE